MSAALYLRGPNKRAGEIKIIDEIKITGGVIIVKKTKEIIINFLIFD